MLKNYLKVALRNISKHKAYSSINIIGLAIGMAACILILLWVQYELSYDTFHEKSDNIYRVLHRWEIEGEAELSCLTQVPLAPAIKEQCPQISRATRFDDGDRQIIRYQDRRFQNDIVAEADNDFLQMFSLRFLQGDIKTALVDPISVVISDEMAEKIFGNDIAIGKTLNIDRRDFNVTGVFEELPENSHFDFDCIVSFDSRRDWLKEITDKWHVSAYYTYVLVDGDADIAGIEKKITGIMYDHIADSTSTLHLQPLNKIHLYSAGLEYSEGQPGSISMIYIFAFIAILVLVIACINYMNIVTARYTLRAKEIGLRKVIGARNQDIRKQFLAESILLTLVAMLLALVLVEIVLPFFNDWYGKNISFEPFEKPIMIIYLFGVAILTGLLAGSYPSFFLASFSPVKILGKSFILVKSNSIIRKGLVVIQFGISISLIIVSSIVFSQLDFMMKADLGFNQENLLFVNMRGGFAENYQNIKAELSDNPDVVSVCTGFPPKSPHWASSEVDWDGKNQDERAVICRYNVDHDYIKTLGIEVLQGRDFNENYPTDATDAFIINQEAAKVMGDANPVGKRFAYEGREGIIIGVINDFHVSSFRDPVYPLVLQINPEELHYLMVRVKPGGMPNIISYLEGRWQETANEFIFEYGFLNDTLVGFYKSEIKMSTIFRWATGLALFISCLGLFGLAAFTVERRIKEIGIRKVLGASYLNIISILSNEYTILILAANIISWPIAYYAMKNWLENFAYRISIDWQIFIAAGLSALLLGLITVSYQSLRAALSNPIDSIRYE